MHPRSLCVFCGSRVGERPIYAEVARDLGTCLAAEGITLVYGGGRVGLMGVVASAARRAGGRVIGVIPDFLMRMEVGNQDVDELIVTQSMHDRKQRMFDLSDGFVVLPGGTGTLDETIEILTWKQLHQHDKPVVLVSPDGYWDPLVALVDAVIADGFAGAGTRRLFEVVEDGAAALAAIRRGPDPMPGGSAGL